MFYECNDLKSIEISRDRNADKMTSILKTTFEEGNLQVLTDDEVVEKKYLEYGNEKDYAFFILTEERIIYGCQNEFMLTVDTYPYSSIITWRHLATPYGDRLDIITKRENAVIGVAFPTESIYAEVEKIMLSHINKESCKNG